MTTTTTDTITIEIPLVNKGPKGFTNWDSEWETKLIVDFLRTNRSILKLSNIESLAEIGQKTLDHLLLYNYKTIKPETIKKLLPVLNMIGFKMIPRPDDDFFYVPVESFESDKEPIKDEITIEHIQKIVCKYYNVPLDMMQSKSRKRELVQCRQIIWYFCKLILKTSSNQNAFYTGNKEHATVLSGLKEINNLIETNKQFALEIDEIEKQIKQLCQ